jgi:hypothetical protein
VATEGASLGGATTGATVGVAVWLLLGLSDGTAVVVRLLGLGAEEGAAVVALWSGGISERTELKVALSSPSSSSFIMRERSLCVARVNVIVDRRSTARNSSDILRSHRTRTTGPLGKDILLSQLHLVALQS